MPSLLVKEGPSRGAVVELCGEEFTVGGEYGSDLWLAGATLHGPHALLSRRQDGWYLQQTPGAGKTWLNGRLIKRARLSHRDEIRIGDCRLVFLDDEAEDEPIVLQRYGHPGRLIHMRRLGDQAGMGGAVADVPHAADLPLSVVLDVAKASDSIAGILTGAVSVIRRVLAADTAVPVLLDGSELRPVLPGHWDPHVSLDMMGVNTHLVHASLMGGYAAAWTDCEPQPHVACAPVRTGSRTIAVVYVARVGRKAEFSQRDLACLMAMAGQAASAIELLTESQKLSRRVSSLERQLALGCQMIGSSHAMKVVYEFIEKVAPTDAGVFLCGETGTGKELVARAIHARSARHDGPLELVNCAAIPPSLLESELFGHVRGAFTGADADRPGRFELADGGTLFLDEITELPSDCQNRLLRVLEEMRVRRLGDTRDRVVDVRIIAATNRDPAEAVARGILRSDLYYRLDRLRVVLPPLRDRKGDVELLAYHFLGAFASRGGRVATITEDALDVLRRYPWPGNVRELKNAIERMVLLCDGTEITVRNLPDRIVAEARVSGHDDFQTLIEVERQHIFLAMARAQGNKSLAARLLGIDRTTLYSKLKRYGLEDKSRIRGSAGRTDPQHRTGR